MLAEALAALPKDVARRQLNTAWRRKSLLAFAEQTTPGYLAGWVHADLCRRLERFSADVAAGKSPRLMVFMPPRHGKSQIVSRRFPVWHMGHHPEHEVMLATYGQSLSNDLSRDALECARSAETQASFPDLRISDKREAVEQWKTTRGGGLSASGVGGPMTGRGAHVLVIDDPVKGAKEADSPDYREDQKRWYKANAFTRLAPGGGVLLTMTRWHQDDLAGWLLEEAREGGDQWEIVCYPAIATADEYSQAGVLLRQAGEALHPARYPLHSLQAIERTIGPYFWAALYQQTPVPSSGQVIQTSWLEHYYTALPARKDALRVMSIDTATKEKESNDPSGIGVFDHHLKKTYVADIWTGRLAYPGLLAFVRAQVELHRPDVVLIEDKGIGTELIRELKSDGKVGRVVAVEPCASKQLRLVAETGTMAAGDFLLPQAAPWLMRYRSQLLGFPKVDHDEEADITSQVLAWLRQSRGPESLFRWR